MKKLIYMVIPILLISACRDDDDTVNTTDITQLNNRVTTCQYAPYTTGSTFTYEQQTTFGSTSTAQWVVNGDKIINNKQYIEVSGMLGLSNTVYFNCENGEYSIRGENVPTVGTLELIYLKENVAVNTKWSQTINQSFGGFNYQTRYDFTYIGNEATRIVKGVVYTNIIHIHLDAFTNASGPMTLFSQDDYYWAEGVGLIEAVGTSANFELISYNIM